MPGERPQENEAWEKRKKGAGPRPRAIGHLLNYLRRREGLLGQDLAEALQVQRGRISQWEWGETSIQDRSIEKIARFFGLLRIDFVELAERLDRSVERALARYKGSAREAPYYPDRTAVLARMHELRLHRRDLEAERSAIDAEMREINREEDVLRSELEKLGDD